ncbi:MAG TPA: alkaline phosphatase family protein [Gemmatimonadaceae bacterium]|nr:alkaline phosphatase family protein [Gemmatimonadaceae bacterium]
MTERRSRPRAGPLLRFYYRNKYRLFSREKRPHDGRRGLIMLQIDALAFTDLERAIERGYCPTISRLLREGDFELRKWFCGLPSATPYCQAGIFHGENSGIPAFRFYDKPAHKVITCNLPEGVQYIRDRISVPGALAGGSSYVNLIDGDAQTVAFTVATREKMTVYQRLGGKRMATLILLHPVRVARMLVQSAFEYLLEEWERLRGEIARRVTHSEGIFPFIRILSNVIIRELQTMAILLDVYLGVPVIYSTFMQYDELAHHFGPSSKQALADLRRTDARISEIWRMARMAGGRQYDMVILSDHGMTPARSYRVQFGESLGATVERILDAAVLSSHSDVSEYADIGPEVLEAVAVITPPASRRRRIVRLARDWLRSRYGLREIIIPEKFRVAATHDVVVTYSSCLALLYFADDEEQLSLSDILGDARRKRLYSGLLAHEGIGLIATRSADGVHVESKSGKAIIKDAQLEIVEGENPMSLFGTAPHELRAVESLVLQSNAGDCVLFGAYDGSDIISFDDQVGAHGSAGGDQTYPFLITPSWLHASSEKLEDARDVHRAVMQKYVGTGMLDSEC